MVFQFFPLKNEKFLMKSVVDIFIHFIREFLFWRSVKSVFDEFKNRWLLVTPGSASLPASAAFFVGSSLTKKKQADPPASMPADWFFSRLYPFRTRLVAKKNRSDPAVKTSEFIERTLIDVEFYTWSVHRPDWIRVGKRASRRFLRVSGKKFAQQIPEWNISQTITRKIRKWPRYRP